MTIQLITGFPTYSFFSPSLIVFINTLMDDYYYIAGEVQCICNTTANVSIGVFFNNYSNPILRQTSPSG